jgi:hypothetical protein
MNIIFNFYGYFTYLTSYVYSFLATSYQSAVSSTLWDNPRIVTTKLFIEKYISYCASYIEYYFDLILGETGLVVQILRSLSSMDDLTLNLKYIYSGFLWYLSVFYNILTNPKETLVVLKNFYFTVESLILTYFDFLCLFTLLLSFVYLVWLFFNLENNYEYYGYLKYKNYIVFQKKYCSEIYYKKMIFEKGVLPRNVIKFVSKKKQERIQKYYDFYVKKGYLTNKEFNYLIYKKLMPLEDLNIYVSKKFNKMFSQK